LTKNAVSGSVTGSALKPMRIHNTGCTKYVHLPGPLSSSFYVSLQAVSRVGTDPDAKPDPRIRTPDERIRMRIRTKIFIVKICLMIKTKFLARKFL
jgi:hypothetical protein